MSSIIVATAREALRAETLLPLAREGYAVRSVADFGGACRSVTDRRTRLLLVDPELPGLRPELLAALAAALPDGASVRSLGEACPPLSRLPLTPRALARAAREAVGGVGFDPAEKREVRAMGLGAEPLETVARLAASPLPLLILGERGTGKERLARAVHRLAGGGPFVVLPPTARGVPPGPAGTLYLESVHRRDDAGALVGAAREAGWRIVAGSRLAEPVAGVAWTRVELPPLRDRPDDLRALATHYLDGHARQMGLPRRVFDRGMWALVLGHRWPGNARELESFVVQALGEAEGPTIRGATLPASLRDLLVPRVGGEGAVEGFEEAARGRLAPVVAAWQPAEDGETLHELVVGSAERALIQLVLARTEGNRKAAARLLGLARNTLQARIRALGIDV